MATVEGGGYPSREIDLPEAMGDLNRLDNVVEGIDHWIGQLLTRIGPVLRPEFDSPEQAMAEIKSPQSPLAERIDKLLRLQSVLAQTVDRVTL